MKNFRVILVAVGILMGVPTFGYAYITKVTVTKITNNTPYDLPAMKLGPYSSTITAKDYFFTENKPTTSTFTSPVYLKGVQQNCLFAGGANNFSQPYISAYFAGGEICLVKVSILQEDETIYHIRLEA